MRRNIKKLTIFVISVFIFNLFSSTVYVKAAETTSNTLIMGQGTLSRNQMIRSIRSKNTALDTEYIASFVDCVIKEANIESVNYDIAFSQMMLETNYLRFGGDVKAEQNNFAGIGATGDGQAGYSFPSVQVGIRAVIQHLKAYASSLALSQTCVDPRFEYVTRESAPYVEWLGIHENPYGKGWASAIGYGNSILNFLSCIKSVSSESVPMASDIQISGVKQVDKYLTVNAVSNEASNVEYKIWVCDRSTDTWKVLSDYSSKSSVTYQPKNAGDYTFLVYTRHSNVNQVTYDDAIAKNITVEPSKAEVKSFEITGTPQIGSTLTVKAEGTAGENNDYKIWVCDRSTDTWKVLSDYSSKNSVTYVPKNAGEYTFLVYTRHKLNTGVIYDDALAKDIKVESLKSKVQSFDITGTRQIGSTINAKAIGTAGADTEYKIWVCDRSTDTWKVISDYSSQNSVNYIPKKAGNYTFLVYTRHKLNTGVTYDDAVAKDIKVEPLISKVQSFDITGTTQIGSTINAKAIGTAGADTEYKIWVCDRSTDTWEVLSNYSSQNSVNYIPKKAGNYTFLVYTRHKLNTGATYDDAVAKDINVSSLKSNVNSFDISGNKLVNSLLTINATGTTATEYKIWVCNRTTDEWTILSDYSKNNSVTFTPKEKGTYSFVVYTRYPGSEAKYDDAMVKDVVVGSRTSKADITVDGVTSVGESLTISSNGQPSEETLYKIMVCDRSTEKWYTLKEYSSKNYEKFVPNKVGEYTIVVHVKNKYSSTTTYDNAYAKDIYVTEKNKSKALSLNVDGDTSIPNKELKFTATASPENQTLYAFYICNRLTGTWKTIQEYSSNSIVNYTSTVPGKFTLVVHVKNINSTNSYDDAISVDFRVGKNKTIVIDPGHNIIGNIDTGASSTFYGSTYKEQLINMDIAEKLKSILESKGYNVILTCERNNFYNDQSVAESLNRRVSLANSINADLFVSIHQNSFSTDAAHGVEVYYSDATPISSPLNWSLSNKVSTSMKIGYEVANNVSNNLGFYNRGLKNNEFYVVKNTFMPSLLVECGFISNYSNLKVLTSEAGKYNIANSIAMAIDDNL